VSERTKVQENTVRVRQGLKRNGCLLYTILPIQLDIDQFYERQSVEQRRAACEQKRGEHVC
jgi:hypothetical protein